MSEPTTKAYPRAHVVKVTANQAGKLWLHARWWITYELRPGVYLSWAKGAPITTHHSYYGDAVADAVRTIGDLRARYGRTAYHHISIQPNELEDVTT